MTLADVAYLLITQREMSAMDAFLMILIICHT